MEDSHLLLGDPLAPVVLSGVGTFCHLSPGPGVRLRVHGSAGGRLCGRWSQMSDCVEPRLRWGEIRERTFHPSPPSVRSSLPTSLGRLKSPGVQEVLTRVSWRRFPSVWPFCPRSCSHPPAWMTLLVSPWGYPGVRFGRGSRGGGLFLCCGKGRCLHPPRPHHHHHGRLTLRTDWIPTAPSHPGGNFRVSETL